MIGNSLNCIYPLQGAAFGKGFIAKLQTARRGDTVEQLATSKCIIRDANYRRRHLYYSKLPTEELEDSMDGPLKRVAD